MRTLSSMYCLKFRIYIISFIGFSMKQQYQTIHTCKTPHSSIAVFIICLKVDYICSWTLHCFFFEAGTFNIVLNLWFRVANISHPGYVSTPCWLEIHLLITCRFSNYYHLLEIYILVILIYINIFEAAILYHLNYFHFRTERIQLSWIKKYGSTSHWTKMKKITSLAVWCRSFHIQNSVYN